MKIMWAEPAIQDLESIKGYIARDSQYYASEFITRILDAVEKLGYFPNIGRDVPEADDERVREVVYYNYRIIYKLEKELILVLAVIHSARDLNNIRPWEFK